MQAPSHMPSQVPLHMPSGVTAPQVPLQLPTQVPSHTVAVTSSHAPTQEPVQSLQPIEQSLPTGPVLLPSAVPLVDALEALLVLLAPGPSVVSSLVPGSVEAAVEASELESSLASSLQAAVSNEPTSTGMTKRGIARRHTGWILESQGLFWVTHDAGVTSAARCPFHRRA